MLQRMRLAVVLLLGTGALVQGAAPPSYKYGESWWQEYRYHADTILLFHFGPPQVSARERLIAEVVKAEEDKKLFDLDELDAAPVLGGDLDPEAYKKGPSINVALIGPDEVQDYASPDRRLKLPAGMRKVPDGRFGEGLQMTGGQGLAVRVDAPTSLELSFRIEAYPATVQCLWSIGKDEARLLLHPDGRLELKLKAPHGHPGAYPGLKEKPSAEELEAIRARDPRIISSQPVPLGQWVHARAYNHPHPTPGGGEPWDARLVIDGEQVAAYLSERYNVYNWLGHRQTELLLGNSAAGDQGFTGVVDEVRLLNRANTFYQRPPMPWRDSTHAIQFGVPTFRREATLFHAPLGEQTTYAINHGGAPPIDLELEAGDPAGLHVPGIRGSGWVMDPAIGFPKLPLNGLDPRQGSLEFWVRPVNWDDATGYWQHTPPRNRFLTIAQCFGKDQRDGQTKLFMSMELERAFNLERSRLPLDPGRWYHCVVTWNENDLSRGSMRVQPVGGAARVLRVRREGELVPHIEPLHLQFGVPGEVEVKWHQKALIEVDEVVAYTVPLATDEAEQAYRRWQATVEPIPLYQDRLEFKWSLQKLEYTWVPRLPEGQNAAAVDVALYREGNEEPLVERTVPIEDGKAFVVLHEATTLPVDTHYRVRFTARDEAGAALLEGERQWHYVQEPWRMTDFGRLTEAPAPWTPLSVDGQQLSTRMSSYTLAGHGLPTQVVAGGRELLATPMVLLEDGQPMEGKPMQMHNATPVQATWSSSFTGESASIVMSCKLEFDGMLRVELAITPRGEQVQPITMEIPVKREHASHYLYYPMGDRGIKTGLVDAQTPVLASRVDPVNWRDYQQARKEQAELTWDAFRKGLLEQRQAYNFFGHVDLHDRERGLFWFCDNAAGWNQSPTTSAIEVVRRGDAVVLRLNLIAEAGAYDWTEPIVFAFLPHPARPMPEKYRLFERVSREQDPKACTIFDAFRPWPMDPKEKAMAIYPKADPANPEAGASWAYAESCIPSMKAAVPYGYRTMYLSLKWLSCRAGAYDHWEWRSGDSGAVSLTPSFVDYLCWEMNEWIGRDIFDAVYLDEAYEEPLRNLEAGMSVRLPDGTEQPGVDNFLFRELMQRWYGIFVHHGKTPMLIGHHTMSFQYPGLLYTEAYLDGENFPIVSLNSRDWLGSTSRHRMETVQNGHLWGIAPFYMPYISEGGFAEERSEFPVWQWRMARQALSQFAHYEVGTVYERQGQQHFRAYWRDVLGWGAGDPAAVTFHPYWNNHDLIAVPGQDGEILVSFYHDRANQRLLLIASNHSAEQQEIRVDLDRQKLGLGPDLTIRQVDSSWEPPPGDDFRKEAAGHPDELAERAVDVKLTTKAPAADILGDFLAEEQETKRQDSLVPRWDGKVLVVPVRPKDFRLLSLE